MSLLCNTNWVKQRGVNRNQRLRQNFFEISNTTENCYHVLVCGDLNSRTGTENDFVILDN